MKRDVVELLKLIAFQYVLIRSVLRAYTKSELIAFQYRERFTFSEYINIIIRHFIFK